MGERLNGIQEVGGSTPPGSTKYPIDVKGKFHQTSITHFSPGPTGDQMVTKSEPALAPGKPAGPDNSGPGISPAAERQEPDYDGPRDRRGGGRLARISLKFLNL